MAQPLMPSATYTLFRNAILGEQQVVCLDDGRGRELCPDIIGTNKRGEEVALGGSSPASNQAAARNGDALKLAKRRGNARTREGRWHEGGSHQTHADLR